MNAFIVDMSQKIEAAGVKASHNEAENMYWSHLAMTIAQYDVELYGTLHYGRRMLVEVMLFYSLSALIRWKDRRFLAFVVLETGNFGHNWNMSYQRRYPYVRRRINGFAFP